MAEESWAVVIPGELTWGNWRLSTSEKINQQTTTTQGARTAFYSRSGNWDRRRPLTLSPSPYDLQNYVLRMPRGRSTIWYPDYDLMQRYDGALQMGQPNWEPSSVIDELRNQALIDALTNLKDQKFNAGVAIAEASGIATMVTDCVRTVTKVRRDFIRGDFRKAYQRFRKKYGGESWSSFRRRYSTSLNRSEILSKVPNTWLYYHFGLKPTVSDIHAAHEDWYRRNAVPGRNTLGTTVRGQAKHVSRANGQWRTSHMITAEDMAMTDVQSMRTYLYVTPKDEFLARLSQMGVTNFPEAAWNGTPFSWMIDYFWSVGDWLSVLDAGMGYEFGTTVESYRRICRYYASSFSVQPNSGSASASPFSCRWTVLQRRLNSELYPPMFRVKPQSKLKWPGPQKWSNMLSVLASLFGGGKPPNVRI